MTLSELRERTRRKLRQTSTTPFSDAEIDRSLNAGYMEMSDASEWYEVYQVIPLLADRPYYDARTCLGASLLAIGAAFSVDTNRWLEPVTVGDMDGRNRRWETINVESAAPIAEFTRGLWWFGYYPRVSSDSGTVKQYFTALPDALDDDDDEPGFHDDFHDGLVEYAEYDLLGQIGEATGALTAWNRYAEVEQDLVTHTQRRGSRARMSGLANTR